MIRKSLIMKIFSTVYMQRWNDKLRPIELVELDKQAHKMFIAYFLGKFEENKVGFNWIEIIEGGIFELLQRLVITDIKPPVFYKIKSNKEHYRRLNEYVYGELRQYIESLGEDFCNRFKAYFEEEDNTLTKKILKAAHTYSSMWEFDIIERLNTDGFETTEIREDLVTRLEDCKGLEGVQAIETNVAHKKFIEICGNLRFQYRWSHLYRIPKTSVLGHSLFVAILSYLFATQINACPKRRANDFFAGLYHDLPEVLTRDIISPVKRSIEGLEDLIKDIEKDLMEEKIYPLIPERFLPEVRRFTEYEFQNMVIVNGKLKKVEEISPNFNYDSFDPIDGHLIKAVDELAAFIEANTAIENGSKSEDLQRARWSIKNKFNNNVIAGINFGEIYADF